MSFFISLANKIFLRHMLKMKIKVSIHQQLPAIFYLRKKHKTKAENNCFLTPRGRSVATTSAATIEDC